MPPTNVPNDPNLSSQLYPKRTAPISPPSFEPESPTQTIPQPPVTPPPFAPIQNTAPVRRGGGKFLVVFVVILILLVAGIAYSYFNGVGPFSSAPYNGDRLISDIVTGMGKIKKASYSLSVNVVSEPKEADVEAFSIAVPSDANKIAAYNRDQDKVRDAKSILDKIRIYYSKNNKYPSSLSSLEQSSATSNKGYTYIALKGQTSFTLSFNFETGDAVSSINNSLKYSGKDTITVKDKTVTIKDSTYAYIYLPEEPRQPAIVDLLKMQSYLAYIPADFKFDGTISGASQKVDEKTINGEAHIIANTDLGDINVAIDTEFKRVSGTLYVIVNKFPSFFGDFSKLKGKWIQFTDSDLATYGNLFFGSSVSSTEGDIAKAKAKSVEQLRLFLSIAEKNKALLSTGKVVKEQVDGSPAYRYDLEFNKENFAQFYTDITTEFKNKYGTSSPIEFDEATSDYLKSPEFDSTFEYFRKNTVLTMWADSQGIPVQLRYSLRMVPESKNNKKSDNQIKLVATITLKDVNKAVTVKAPESPMTMEDATIAITGQSKEQYRFDKQISNIATIRYALDTYKRIKKVYPSTLEDLTKTKSEYGSGMIMKSIPKDIYDNNAFLYEGKGVDYKLMYEVELPAYIKGNSVNGIYEYSYDYLSTKKDTLVMKAVNGQNTAGSKHLSDESYEQSKKDSDGDRLPDIFEKYIGTDVSKKDTDKDGYSDYDEVIKNSNPLGPGNLKSGRGGGSMFGL